MQVAVSTVRTSVPSRVASLSVARKAATGSNDWPMCPDRERTFSDSTAEPHMRAWASTDGSGDKDKMDWDKYASVHFWRDPNNTQAFAGYKLKFCDMVDGKVNAIWHAITVAGVEVDGGRGGLDVPEADKPGIRDKIGGYYAKARDAYNDPSIQAPWHDAGKSTKPPLAKRMLSTLEIKAVAPTADASGRRWFEGIASTPSTDRTGDTVQPKGAKFKLPLPLLYQHDSMQPIGQVTEASVKPSGIYVKGYVEQVDGPPTLKERLDVAYTEMKLGLVRGLSIGFNPLEAAPIDAKNPWGGTDYTSWEWLELSPVTIAANQDASITNIKSIAERTAPALGQMASAKTKGAITNLPGASGHAPVSLLPKALKMKTIQERIKEAENKRAANVGAMQNLMDDADAKGETLDADRAGEYDGLELEVKQLDAHILRLKSQEKLGIAGAQAVQPTAGMDGAPPARTTVRIEHGKSNLPKGTAFTRMALALAFTKGNVEAAAKMADTRWKDSTPEVGNVLRYAGDVGGTDFAVQQMQMDGVQKSAIAAGNTTDAAWASPLVQFNNLASEFVSLLYPQTILGRINGLRKVPFNIRFPSQTAGASVGWVGQGAAKPVSKLSFATNTLGFSKAAGIVVITQELARFSSPAAEELVQTDLINTMAQFQDQQFINPGIIAVANVSPASVTNGATAVQSSGATRALIDADVANVFSGFLTANIPLTSLVWVMTPYSALKLSLLREANGQPSYPDISINGGTWEGIPVLTSNNVPNSVSAGSIIVLMAANEIFYANDGGIQLDASEQASVQMDSAPTGNGVTPTATTLVSLWQENLIGIRAEIICNWQPRRTAAISYIDNVHL